LESCRKCVVLLTQLTASWSSGAAQDAAFIREDFMSKVAYRVAGLSLASVMACGLAGLADAQLLARKDLSLAAATAIAQGAIATCKSQGYSISVHVVGREGQVIVAVRGDGAGLNTMENSMKKAYTART